jgi:hypothetical protein
MLTRSFGHHHDEISGPCKPGSEEHAVALVALADYLANTISPAQCDLGFDPEILNVENLHLALGLTLDEIADQEDDIRDVVFQSSIYLDIR